jgi:hypothetical protein
VTDPAPTLRLALDQNFPTPLIGAVTDYLPDDIEIKSLRRIDPRLSELDDRTLFLTLHHLGWHGLVTNNYKMRRTGRDRADTSCRSRCRGPRARSAPGSGGAAAGAPWPVEASPAASVECVSPRIPPPDG